MIEFNRVDPVVFIAAEAAQYLRLDVGRDMPKALKALTRLVDEKKLIRPVMYRKERLYRREELDRFLEDQQR